MSFGPPPGSPLAGPTGSGLPFAGIPPELAERAQRILDAEPDHDVPRIDFAHVTEDTRPFTLRRFLAPHKAGLAVALVLVTLETLSLLAGPLLVQAGVDRGITPKDFQVVLVVSGLYLLVILANIALGSAAGRLDHAAWASDSWNSSGSACSPTCSGSRSTTTSGRRRGSS